MRNDKIYKYSEFLKEGLSDTPEELISIVLKKIKSKIEKMFEEESTNDSGNVQNIDQFSKKEKKEKGHMSFADLGIELQSCELSKYSKMYDNVKVKFSDEQCLYDLTITIDLKEAVSEAEDKELTADDIKECFIKFKKYDTADFSLIGELTKTIKVKDINEDLLISLKIEIDEDFGEENEEEFKIET